MADILEQLLQEERELQFEKFNEGTAWRLGSALVQKCFREGLPVTVDITRGERQLFHASLPGACADNDEWIKRKVRLVYRFEHSSYYIGQLLKSKGKSVEEMFLLPESQYAPHGGCFPIIVKNSGMVGAIAVSGLPQEEDHRLAVQAIRDYLNKER
ncbi:MAG: heme-degrading domain-containing protein [Chloroflexi bacterium]|nr:heme-degrading domain-containing protein [Chloroflexota bacterium]